MTTGVKAWQRERQSRKMITFSERVTTENADGMISRVTGEGLGRSRVNKKAIVRGRNRGLKRLKRLPIGSFD